MDEKDLRWTNMKECTMGVETGPQTIIVRQVIGEAEAQKVQDIQIRVPDQKPPIEQIVDVIVKNVCITDVDVIHDKIIVRGDYEIKAIYVACLPDQPVHAVEIKHQRFTQDVVVPGARRGMDADATVTIEFVDFDFDTSPHDTDERGYKYHDDDYETPDETPDENTSCESPCESPCETPCEEKKKCHHHHHHKCCTRHFDVSVVLKVVAKVYADREIMIGGGAVPPSPKG